MPKILLISCVALCLLLPSWLYAKDHFAPLTLAKNFSTDVQNPVYWVSEKFDGVRCYWDGKMLLTRNGNAIQAPKWFIEQLPNIPVDGELWAGYGGYQTVTSTVFDNVPDDAQWRQISYLVFDLPNSSAVFEERQQLLNAAFAGRPRQNVKLVEHVKLDNLDAIENSLASVMKKGGEGLMLRVPGSLYVPGRSDALLKFKDRQDNEARVIAYQAGRGKYENMMGAVWVELDNGKMFKIGTGFSDEERQNPPPIGSNITFTHQGFTNKGLPRFASFERIRLEK